MTLSQSRYRIRWIGLAVLFLAFTSRIASAQAVDTLHAVLDFSTPIEQGWLDPATDRVGLRGDHAPLSWQTTLEAFDQDGDGIYEMAIPFVMSGDSINVAYKLKVDAENAPHDGWQEGENHQVILKKGSPSHFNLAWDDVMEPTSTITGDVDIIRGVSDGELPLRDVFVYLPPGYRNSDSRYPVLYLHDGQNVFDAAASGMEWRVDEVAERLIRAGEIEPLIVVGVGNTADRMDEYTPTRQIWRHELRRIGTVNGPGSADRRSGVFLTEIGDTLRVRVIVDSVQVQLPGYTMWQPTSAESDSTVFVPGPGITLHFAGPSDAQSPVETMLATKPPAGGSGKRYGQFLIETIKPAIDEEYRTRPGPESTALGGSSLGGLITLYLGLDHPEIFGKLLVASPSVWWDNRWILKKVQDLPGPTGQRLWLDIGTSEPGESVANTRALRDAFQSIGWPSDAIHYVEAPDGVHNENAWAARVPDMLRYLFPN